MHRILLRVVVLDLPDETHDVGRAFWATALTGRTADPHDDDRPEYSWLHDPASPNHVLVQRLDSGESRVHLDLETDDMEAEIARLERAGATRVERFERWQVMRDPTGMPFCVIPPQSEDFDRLAREVQD
jgi:hypothetical protein